MINALYYKTPNDLHDAFYRLCRVKTGIPCFGCPVWEWYKANEMYTTIDCPFVFAMLDHKKSKRKKEMSK